MHTFFFRLGFEYVCMSACYTGFERLRCCFSHWGLFDVVQSVLPRLQMLLENGWLVAFAGEGSLGL